MSGAVAIWRIASEAPGREAHDLSGGGAARSGGRWNRKGTPLVYASASRALACLETVVHLGGGLALPLNRFLVEITVPSEIWKRRARFDPEAQVGWDALPAGRVSLDWGTAWARGNGALLAEVPSVLVPEEPNLLINPAHDDLARLRARKVRQWTYDPRLRS